MESQYTLSKIENLYEEVKECVNIYSESITELNYIINSLSSSLISQQTGTYETFLSLYKNKYSRLTDMENLMKTFCEKISDKKNILEEQSKMIINSFE